MALAAVLNAPRVAEARHEAAAHAMQTQAVVTGLAVAGMLLLVALLALALVLVVGLLLWGMVTGRLAMVGRVGTQPLKQRRMQIHHVPTPAFRAGPSAEGYRPVMSSCRFPIMTPVGRRNWIGAFGRIRHGTSRNPSNHPAGIGITSRLRRHATPGRAIRNAPDDLQTTAAWETGNRRLLTVAAQEAAAIAHALMATDTAATATTSAQSTCASQEATATTQAGYTTATYQASVATATAQAAMPQQPTMPT